MHPPISPPALDNTSTNQMIQLVQDLYPICRSITGDGVRQTLRYLQGLIPLQIHEVPSGTPVFDWIVPPEWNIRDAYIKNAAGQRLIDFRQSSLHVLNYSTPIDATLSMEALKGHLFTLPDQPTLIPYRTSYYAENWGFCLSQQQLEQLQAEPNQTFEVKIDSTLQPGSLTYGEYVIAGSSDEEILISCHVCHPSLCNDNLSGIAIAVALASHLAQQKSRYTYRFLFIPGTIGSITWLALHEELIPRIKSALVLTCLGDAAPMTYKLSRDGAAPIDRAALYVLEKLATGAKTLQFYPYGYDERQYNSPGIGIPAGAIMRSQHGTFPEYHTSADNLTFIKPEMLADSLTVIRTILEVVDANVRYVNLSPKGEPQLGRRGIYKAISGQQAVAIDQMALLWVLNLSDGQHDLLQIAQRSGLPFTQIKAAADLLHAYDLLKLSSGIVNE